MTAEMTSGEARGDRASVLQTKCRLACTLFTRLAWGKHEAMCAHVAMLHLEWSSGVLLSGFGYRGVSLIRNGGAGINKQLGPDCLLPARNKQLAKFRVFRLPT